MATLMGKNPQSGPHDTLSKTLQEEKWVVQILVRSILGIFVNAEEGPYQNRRVGEVAKEVEE